MNRCNLKSVLVLIALIVSTSCKKNDIQNTTDSLSANERFYCLPQESLPIIKNIANDMKRMDVLGDFARKFSAKYGYLRWEHSLLEKVTPQFQSLNATEDTIVSIPFVKDGEEFVNAILSVKVSDMVESYSLLDGYEYETLTFNNDTSETYFDANELSLSLAYFDAAIFEKTDFLLLDSRLFAKAATPDIYIMAETNPYTGCITLYTSSVYTSGWVAVRTVCGSLNGSTTKQYELQHYLTLPEIDGGGGPSDPNAQCRRPIGQITGFDEDGIAVIGCEDDYGFVPGRVRHLRTYLNILPAGLLPCEELYAINSYGGMFQRVANYAPPQAVRDKIDFLNSEPTYFLPQHNLQNLSQANGTIVSCDFFPLKITQFPINPFTQTAFTPTELLEYFRRNINDFVTQTSNTHPEFSCNVSDDCNTWDLWYEQSLTAVINVRIPTILNGWDDGGLIVSDYRDLGPTPVVHPQFKFSTLTSPFAFTHPVAGNREFGIYNTSQNPSEFTFYTIGVDRVQDAFYSAINFTGEGFDRADDLWLDILTNLKDWINVLGGSATNYVQTHYTSRLPWEHMKAYLMGQITFEELKAELGC